MARNIVYEVGDRFAVAATDPATPASGDPIRVGELPGVAITAEDGNGNTTVAFHCVATLSVRGVDGSGNAAVSAGDILYYVDADTPKISKKTAGHRFGYALEAVGSGSTATIKVKIGY